MQRRTYQLKEFDYIVPKSKMAFIRGANNGICPIEDEDFDLLKDYLLTSVKDEGRQLFQTVQFTLRAKWGEVIQLKNYVGMIELRNGSRIEILPKIFDKGSQILGVDAIKNLLLKMLSALKDFPLAIDLGPASLNLQSLSLYEIFIHIYLNRVLEFTKVGLKSDYSLMEENLPSFRGRLKVTEQIRANHSHAERFFVTHDEYSLSRPENRIIKTTLLKLLRATEDEENRFLARKLLNFFDAVPVSDDFEMDYRRIAFDSSNIGYLGAIQWSMVFLRNKSFSIFGGENNGQALLFPMDRIFERFIAAQINRLIRLHNQTYGTKYRFISQEATKYLFDVPKAFKIKPDIKITGTNNIILDTKWKILSDKKAHNNVSQGDMYQMYAYSKRYFASQVFLLYPNCPASDFITQRSFKANDELLPTTVSLHFLNLKNISDFADKPGSLALGDGNSLYNFLKIILSQEVGSSQTILMA